MTTMTRRWMATADVTPVSGMNATPLIDVLLVLLIMFIITLPVMTHAVRIDLPLGRNEQATSRPVIRIDIEYGGAAVVNGQLLDTDLDRYFALAHASAHRGGAYLHQHARPIRTLRASDCSRAAQRV